MAEAKDLRINLVAASMKGLLPTTLITAELNPLISDGERLAEKLKAADVKVDLKNYDGVTHEFSEWPPLRLRQKMARLIEQML